ncbi:hypothetical protein [Bacillus toyonensis]|uniref:DUF3947 domain-containing protein n=1 Tax=Bacillus toyonensis TaxID=155322 RepID=A0A2C4QPY8_9BACI|nr:hypothetical protein [Bacillus toyonensis]PGB03765.1 hypothetical protein COL93_05290 [Bacillus toyonensis]PHD67127.1 hypothetical protein COF40_19965 [Bacillus toyonensis]
MINPYYIKNRAIGGVYTSHGAQSTMHAVYHAMQHMPYYQHPAIPYYETIQYHPSIEYTPQSIYPTIFTTIPLY